MTPTPPPTPDPAPAETPPLNAAQRAAVCGALGLVVWPEPVTGFLGGVAVSVGKTLINRWRATAPGRRSLAGAAKRRYDTALAVLARSGLGGAELAAAREAARQQYLRELAEALK